MISVNVPLNSSKSALVMEYKVSIIARVDRSIDMGLLLVETTPSADHYASHPGPHRDALVAKCGSKRRGRRENLVSATAYARVIMRLCRPTWKVFPWRV